jgi:hypothetical protein
MQVNRAGVVVLVSQWGNTMVQRPVHMNAFEFVVLSSLRAAQLMRGCVPRVASTQKMIMTAQLEVAAGKVGMLEPELPAAVV